MIIDKTKIIYEPNPILREVSKPLTFPLTAEQKETYVNMMEYILYTQSFDDIDDENLEDLPAVGLAAVQVGRLERMFAFHIHYPEEPNKEDFSEIMINPVIVDHGDEFESDPEECISVLDPHSGNVWRYEWVRIKWQNILGETKTKMLTGYDAIVFQHEFDHLDGVLYYDRIK